MSIQTCLSTLQEAHDLLAVAQMSSEQQLSSCLQVMDKIFMSIVLLLSSFWDAAVPAAEQGAQGKSAGLKRADVAVAFLDTLAHVQFCRMRLSAYSVLLQSLLQATASSAEVCCTVSE